MLIRPEKTLRFLFALLCLILPENFVAAADILWEWDSGSVGNITSYAVEDLTSGIYFFTVIAYSDSGIESPYSNAVTPSIGRHPVGMGKKHFNKFVLVCDSHHAFFPTDYRYSCR